MRSADSLVCLTGGTGYIGGRLLPLLESRGARMRRLTRRPGSLHAQVSRTTQVVEAIGDSTDCPLKEDQGGDRSREDSRHLAAELATRVCGR